MMVYSTHVSLGARPLVPPEHVCMYDCKSRPWWKKHTHTHTHRFSLEGIFHTVTQVTFTQAFYYYNVQTFDKDLPFSKCQSSIQRNAWVSPNPSIF